MISKLFQTILLLLLLAACTSVGGQETQPTVKENEQQIQSPNPATSTAIVVTNDPQPTIAPPSSPTPMPTVTAIAPSLMGTNRFDADDERIRYNGRFDFQDPKAPSFDWSATGIEVNFSGTEITILLQDGRNSYNVEVDERSQVLKTEWGKEAYLIAENLEPGQHHLALSKRTEAYVGAAEFMGLIITGGELESPPSAPDRLIEFVGDSITAGYGNEGESPDCWFTPDTQNADQTYAAMTARELNAGYTLIALSGLGVIRNLRAESAVSAETAVNFINRALGLNPYVIWPADRGVPDAVVINLGTNDFSSVPFPADEEFISAYMELLGAVRTRYPQAMIFAVAGPLMLGPAPRVIETAVQRFVSENDDNLLQFVLIENNLESSAEDFGCDYHPNVQGHRKIADQLILFMANRLGW
jgi:lysophospholipase L1-like esterase